ncbi:hypothetical protein Cgig2_028693 [Carnegiea gigantea]|uniref:Fatty acyl-CoA reductase n=1 Tax=Carnegiea gigantea TaxID=171969 RepID=A0A9Q1QG57_9CARY|nr:hypothetical protein Cgig2_028693 [Carnegiea gigantea]
MFLASKDRMGSMEEREKLRENNYEKVFVEKVLRTQPNAKKLYLLFRADDKKSTSLRLQNEDLFKVLKQKIGANFESLISEKVAVVPGDISCKDLSIKDLKLRDELLRDTDVIVNLAATTKLFERCTQQVICHIHINTFLFPSLLLLIVWIE